VLVVVAGLRVEARAAGDPPQEAAALNEQALASLRSGDPDAAVRLLERAEALVPDEPAVRRNLAAALVATAGRLPLPASADRARMLLDRAIELHPSRLDYRYRRAALRVQMGRDAERFFARDDLVRVLAGDPDHRASLVLLGSIAWIERDLEEAVLLWSRALELDPDDAELRARLALARRELETERDYDSLRGQHFVIRHAPAIPAGFAAGVLTLAETAWGDLCPRFGYYPEDEIVITLYPGTELQQALRLHRWVGGVSDGTIRLRVPPGASPADLRAVLRHEFTHHLLRRVAPGTPPWLHEGLACMAEGRSRTAAEARLYGAEDLRAAELDLAVAGESDPGRARRFYDLAFAFTSWLHAQGGDSLILGILDDLAHGLTAEESLQRRLGAGRDELFARWRERLRAG